MSAKFSEVHYEPGKRMAALKHSFPQLLKNLRPKVGSALTSRGLQRSVVGRGIGNFVLPKNCHRYKVEFDCCGEKGSPCSQALRKTEARSGQERPYYPLPILPQA